MVIKLQSLLEESHEVVGLGLIDFAVNLLSSTENLECWELLNSGAFGNFAQCVILDIDLYKVHVLILVLLGIPRQGHVRQPIQQTARLIV